jgi:pimeloyl-ACP methyl ester carboxylesterase
MLRGDGGRAYLRIMRSYELTLEFEAKIVKAMTERKYPAQVAWGEKDPALPIHKTGEEVRQMVGVDAVHPLPGKHFVQEDAPAEIAQLVASLTRSSVA